jgi:hypothetical protein
LPLSWRVAVGSERAGDAGLPRPARRARATTRPATGQVFTLKPGAPVYDMAFAPAGSRAFILQETNSGKGIARIVDFSNGTSVAVRKPAGLFAWESTRAPAGRRMAARS